MGIRLSEKHGVNPSLIVCPVCGKDMAIALFGRLKGDAKAPMKVQGNELCDDCKKEYITIIEVYSEENRKATGRQVFVPRNSLSVDIKEDAAIMCEKDFTEMFNNKDNGKD